jgi:uncharacterized membrane protein YjjB (DUF3815 family)
MKRRGTFRRFRNAASKTWLGASLAVFLLLAESLAVTHPLDFAAHDNGQSCAVCVSVTHLGHGATSTPIEFSLEAAAPSFVASVAIAFVSVSPSRRYARGPPAVSFAL